MRPGPRLAVVALLVSLAGAGAAQPDSGAVPLHRIALGELGGWIALEATVGGRRGRWLLDSGASRNLVAPALARQLGLRPSGALRADTPLGAVQGGEAELPPLAVGGFERRGQRALVVELARLLGAAAEGVDGVLGVPWLEGQQADIDLHTWTGRFGAAGPADCPPGLEPLALTRYRTLPVVTLDVGSSSQRYVFDTGNPAGLIRIEADAPDAAAPGLSLPGDMLLTVLREAALGPQARTEVPVTRLTSPTLRRALGDAARGLAGTAFMDGARWVLDLAHDRLCVQTARFATPGGFGLVPERAGEALRVQLVLPGSPASRAGLRAGDPIRHWAGLPASTDLASLWQAVQGRDELRLGVGEPAREVTLERAIFAPVAP
jgi:hypothetical protein